ncbi:glycosyltransferase [Pseudomonas mangiferae]|uniref:Glycosyltransferase n=1 Tax=Pseudomonas mangiferae TaxID=2593654 RepID=A0A553GWC0_9PSED|nr:glycosyltransferase [Pseudomonas mangiferae]TRX73786.1 glycosyltransferase [Pseudomonas mangiferae]
MSAPRVSLVVPVYNGAAYVAETLDSLLAQAYPDLEVIVIDDGSTDATWDVLQPYADRCRLLRQANRGQAATLNQGWSLAEGELLGYLSADDTLEPQAIARLVAALQARPQGVMVYPDFWLFDAEGVRLRKVDAPPFVYAEVVLEGACPVGPGALFRRELLPRIGGWDPHLRQIPDWEFLLRVGLCGEVVHCAEPLASFRVHEQSQTFAVSDEARSGEYAYVLDGYFRRDDIPEAIRRRRHLALANGNVLMARLHLGAGRWGRALGCLATASRAWPAWFTRRQNLRLLLHGLLGRPLHRLRRLLRHLRERSLRS